MLVGDLISASMEEQLPLQAAELLGWHLQRNYAKQQLAGVSRGEKENVVGDAE